MTTENTAFKNIQYEFAAHLRDPDHASAPNDIEDRAYGDISWSFLPQHSNFYC